MREHKISKGELWRIKFISYNLDRSKACEAKPTSQSRLHRLMWELLKQLKMFVLVLPPC